jgi:lysozyme family protein
MADFTKAFKITVTGNEGSYNPGNGEKETYSGIDRGANPQWSGWAIIDAIKANHTRITISQVDALLSQNTALQSNITHFYKANYWDTVNLNKVADQQLAGNLFDCAVNQGEGLARKFMQIACNDVIAAIKSPIKPLITDRIIGPATLAAFNALPPAALNAQINALRWASYKIDAGFAEWGEVWQKRLLKYT